MIRELKDDDLKLKLDDLYLCGYLASKGLLAAGIETTRGGRRHFVYTQEKQKEITRRVLEFYSGDVQVSLPMLRNHIKDLKEVLRDG